MDVSDFTIPRPPTATPRSAALRHVLVVAYLFPPDGGAGAQRLAKFCKYLPQFGWRPTVITRPAATGGLTWLPADEKLLKNVATDARVVRVAPQERPTGWAAGLPPIDVAAGWMEPALAAMEELARTDPAEVALLTMSPFDLCFLGDQIQRRLRIPVIYDLRDPWALNGWRLHGTRARWARDHAVMRAALRSADGLVINTPDAVTAFCKAIPELRRERMETITNGFDAEDFAGSPPALSDKRGPLRLIHAGMLLQSAALYKYRGPLGWLKRLRHYRPEPIRPAGHSPNYLLKAIRLLQAQGHSAGWLKLVLIGVDDSDTRRCIAQAGLLEQVEFTGYRSHIESIAAMRAADALFLPLHGLPPGRRSIIVPAKTYEYLASGRPILGCLPAGDARDWVAQSGRGHCADPCDARDIARALAALHDAWLAGKYDATPTLTSLKRFERQELTSRLAAFLDRIVSLVASSASAALPDVN